MKPNALTAALAENQRLREENAVLIAAVADFENIQNELDIIRCQMCFDAACIAANEVLHMGAGRAKAFYEEYRDAYNNIMDLFNEDGKDDEDMIYAKDKLDDVIKPIVGKDNFQPWTERYQYKGRRVYVKSRG